MTLCGDWKTCDLLSTPYNNISPQLPGHSRKQVTCRTICTRAIQPSCILSQKYHLFCTLAPSGPKTPLWYAKCFGLALLPALHPLLKWSPRGSQSSEVGIMETSSDAAGILWQTKAQDEAHGWGHQHCHKCHLYKHNFFHWNYNDSSLLTMFWWTMDGLMQI